MLNAFCRVAPSVRFNVRAILAARLILFASAFNVRTCSDVYARRFDFRRKKARGRSGPSGPNQSRPLNSKELVYKP
jgi:hypothetical protein